MGKQDEVGASKNAATPPTEGLKPWTTPRVTPARIETTTNKMFPSISEFSPLYGPS